MYTKLLFTIVFFLIGTSIFSQKNQKVKISTEYGDMIAILYDDTPNHRDNFIKNVKEGLYNETLFHRVIPSFMIQGGDPASVNAAVDKALGSDRCGQINAEIRRQHFHKKGAISAARLPDGSNPNRMSSACQFFIVDGYKFSDKMLDGMETENYKFPEKNRAFYKALGGYPTLDMQYTVFGEVIDGLEVIDIIAAIRTGKNVKDRPNADVKMTISLID